MKKIITLFISILIVGLANGQTASKEKQKVPVHKEKDTVKKAKTQVVIKQEKTLQPKDSLDKSKLQAIPEVISDSLLLVNAKFKFYKKSAHASYYADKFHGKKTASGKRYDKNKYTAAHKKFPYGTMVKVTNEANGKSVIVEVIDRGPFVRAREIDLSKRAFMEIASNKASGAMKVTIEVLQK